MIDVTDLITELLPALNAASTADLTWWTADNLYDYASELLAKLARTAAVFADFDEADYTGATVDNPDGCLVVLHVSSAGRSLRAALVRELEALDAAWQTRTTAAATYYIDPVNGDDANNGRAIATAWQTTTRADALTLASGQTVAYCQGGTWVLYRTPGMLAADTDITSDVVTATADTFDGTRALTDSGPTRWVTDVGGLGSITIYPAPVAPIPLARIFHAMPAPVSTGSYTVATAPAPVASYLYWAMLGRAREKEGESAMPDVAAHARERLALFERACVAYYGATP